MANVKNKKTALKKKLAKAKKPAAKPTVVLKKTKLLKKEKSAKLKEPARKDVEKKVRAKTEPAVPRPAPKPMTPELEQIRNRLTQMLNDLRKDIDHEVRGASERDLAHIIESSDMAADSADGELALRIAESETVEAGEIERAIEKIDNGTYGVCETCNKNIGADRLQFLPFATMCIKCQELAEIRKKDAGDELDDLAEGADDSES